MKKPFTNPTPIEPKEGKSFKEIAKAVKKLSKELGEPEQKKIEKLSYAYVIDITLTNKINEIIDFLNTHYSKDVRGGKFGGKII